MQTLFLYSYGVLTRIITFVTSALSSILIVKIFAVEGKGVLAVYNNSIGLIASFASLSIGSGVIYYSRKHETPFYGLKNSESMLLLISILMLPLLFVSNQIWTWMPFLSTNHVFYIWIIITFQVLSKPLEAGFTAVYASVIIVRLEILRSAIYLGGLLFLLVNTSYSTIDNALLLIATSFGCKFILARFLARNHMVPVDFAEFKSILKYSLSSFWGNVIQKYNVRVDIIILAIFTTPINIGVYSLLVMYAQLQWVVVDGVSIFYGPKLIDSKSENTRRKSVLSMVLWIIFLCLLIMIMQLFLAEFLFSILFEIDIKIYFEHLRVLLLASLVFSIVKVLTKYFSAIGRPSINSYSALTTFISTMSIGIYLMSKGILGASYASLISYSIGLSYLLIRYWIPIRK